MDIPDMTQLQTWGFLGIAIGIATLVVTLQKVFKNFRKEREEYAAKVMQAAKEEDAILKAKLEARIERIDAQLKNLELNVSRDMLHLKETYTNEIKNLGEKIEALRSDLSSQHGSLLALLTKLVEKNKH